MGVRIQYVSEYYISRVNKQRTVFLFNYQSAFKNMYQLVIWQRGRFNILM